MVKFADDVRGDLVIPDVPKTPRERLASEQRRLKAAQMFVVDGEQRKRDLWDAEMRFHSAKNEGNSILADFTVALHLGTTRSERLEELERQMNAAHDDVQRAQEAITAYAEEDAAAQSELEAAQRRVDEAVLRVVLEEISRFTKEAREIDSRLIMLRSAMHGLRQEAMRVGHGGTVANATSRGLYTFIIGSSSPNNDSYLAEREKYKRQQQEAAEQVFFVAKTFMERLHRDPNAKLVDST